MAIDVDYRKSSKPFPARLRALLALPHLAEALGEQVER